LNPRRILDNTYQSTAAISIGYIIVVTPWAIQKVITAYTRTVVSTNIFFSLVQQQNECQMRWNGPIMVKALWKIHQAENDFFFILLKAPQIIEFFVSLLACSHKITTPLIYWTFNRRFRRTVQVFFATKVNIKV